MILLDFKKIIHRRLEEKSPLLQVLVGPRQVGKSTAAEQIFQAWQGPKLMVSADSPSPPRTEWIRFHWEQARLKGDGTLLIIDEVRKVPQWSEQVKLLFDQDRHTRDLRVLLLGSSSLYLQKGLQESLAGRFELVRAQHWTYRNFLDAFDWDFETYLKFGAYPGAVSLIQDEGRWRTYLQDSIIEPVLGKDILALHPVNKPALFRQTFDLAMHYPAQVLSLQKMLGQLQDRGNATTIKHYLELFEKSFLLLPLQKYSGSVLRTRASSPKLLPLNHALIHAYQPTSRLQQDPEWYGRVLESVLGSHLAQLPNTQLYYWSQGSHEVDFVIQRPQGTWALEIKSGLKQSTGRSLWEFSRRFPEVRCDTWALEACLEFMKSDRPESFFDG